MYSSPSLPIKEEADEESFSSHKRYYFGPSRLLTKRIHIKSNDGTLDFTITGGNYLQPIQVASVVWASQAYLQGMRPGDQIICVNGIAFQQNIDYTKALQILYSSNELDIIIRTLRINSLDATLYDWYDPIQQRVTSPPPGNYLSNDAQLPYFERTVTISVEKGKRLGLIIRGGAEYGLGIFISGVDKGSLSDQAGLSIGDQILSVNGIDFLHITHSDAVQLLRNIDKMSFHLRQINKLPKPKDEIKKINNKSIRTSPRVFPKIISKHKSLSDVSSSSLINSKTNFFQQIIDTEDQLKVKHFLSQYLQEKIHIDQLMKPLLQILIKQNQQYRNEIIESIRRFVRRNDLDRFDIYIIKDDLTTLKLSHERLIQTSLSSSRMSFHSPIYNISKSVENLSIENDKRLIRPKSLFLEEQIKQSFDQFSPRIQRKFSIDNKNVSMNNFYENNNLLRKTKSLHNVNKQEEFILLNKSRTNLTIEQQNIIEDFLKDYSLPYPITIHKIRPTLGVAIEGGFQDRIPLPRIVYMQPDGCAYVSSGLRVGHVIIGLNGYSMKELLHKEAALFIASSFKDKSTSSMDLLVVEPLTKEQKLSLLTNESFINCLPFGKKIEKFDSSINVLVIKYILTNLCLYLYTFHLCLTTICTPEMYFNWFLIIKNCRFTYSSSHSSYTLAGGIIVSIPWTIVSIYYLIQYGFR
ncbi:unnamed protein product [Rotaria magnacalcarata]|uniref:PDZ domain-containing protein n=2 Tax=Rotaria magnacalcarata TaxID=392030 RepID=A0A816KTE2_9BILA|nr:unnamed protein product [Rotaria magnacalcarata]CAF1567218.1 unnamed protein product [Rotaria magnacalcarata]CAF1923052.1 unnamed protein product [Rotaria magnacalcarata]